MDNETVQTQDYGAYEAPVDTGAATSPEVQETVDQTPVDAYAADSSSVYDDTTLMDPYASEATEELPDTFRRKRRGERLVHVNIPR